MSFKKGRALRQAALCLSILVFCPICITACQNASHKTEHSSLDPAISVEAKRIAGKQSVFTLSSEVSRKTPREDLLELVEALDEAYAALDYAPPYPRVRIVSRLHPRLRHSAHSYLRGQVLGVAAITADGEARLYFNRTALMSHQDLKPLVLHELAHLKAWRMHGLDIAEHGPEFTRICRSVSRPANCTAQ